ncbi:hypothetical protein BJX76DRAFT_294620 [Aspergillus varians]
MSKGRGLLACLSPDSQVISETATATACFGNNQRASLTWSLAPLLNAYVTTIVEMSPGILIYLTQGLIASISFGPMMVIYRHHSALDLAGLSNCLGTTGSSFTEHSSTNVPRRWTPIVPLVECVATRSYSQLSIYKPDETSTIMRIGTLCSQFDRTDPEMATQSHPCQRTVEVTVPGNLEET